MLELRDLRIDRGGFPIVRGVDMEVAPGAVTVRGATTAPTATAPQSAPTGGSAGRIARAAITTVRTVAAAAASRNADATTDRAAISATAPVATISAKTNR